MFFCIESIVAWLSMLKLIGVPLDGCWLMRGVSSKITVSSASNIVCSCAVPSWYLSDAVSKHGDNLGLLHCPRARNFRVLNNHNTDTGAHLSPVPTVDSVSRCPASFVRQGISQYHTKWFIAVMSRQICS